MKKKGFTLIEMVIVIVIAGILLALTINFGANRIQMLRYQSSKAQFINNYEKLYSEVLTTNYHYQQRFDTFHIILKSESNKYDYEYKPTKKYTQKIEDKVQIQNMQFDSDSEILEIEQAELIFTPYKVGCELKLNNDIRTGGKLQFKLQILDSYKNYCFEIDLDHCKIIEKNVDKNKNICEYE